MHHIVVPAIFMVASISALMTDLPLPSGESMLKDGVAIGVMGLALLWMIARTIPAINKQNAEAIRDICRVFESRLSSMAEQEHEDREKLNETLQKLHSNCAENRANQKLLESNRIE